MWLLNRDTTHNEQPLLFVASTIGSGRGPVSGCVAEMIAAEEQTQTGALPLPYVPSDRWSVAWNRVDKLTPLLLVVPGTTVVARRFMDQAWHR